MVSPHRILPSGLLIFPAEPGGLVLLNPVGRTLRVNTSCCVKPAGHLSLLTLGRRWGLSSTKTYAKSSKYGSPWFHPDSHLTTLPPSEPFGKSKPREQETNQPLLKTNCRNKAPRGCKLSSASSRLLMMNGWTWYYRVLSRNPALGNASISGRWCVHCFNNQTNPPISPASEFAQQAPTLSHTPLAHLCTLSF